MERICSGLTIPKLLHRSVFALHVLPSNIRAARTRTGLASLNIKKSSIHWATFSVQFQVFKPQTLVGGSNANFPLKPAQKQKGVIFNQHLVLSHC